MVRTAGIGLLLGLLQSATALPPFEIYGASAVSPLESPPQAFGECEKDDREVFCVNRKAVLANVKITLRSAFFDGKLYHITARPYIWERQQIVRAFEEKYGPPCERRMEKTYNRLGNTLEHEVIEWCFATGRLSVNDVAPGNDRVRISYTDDANPPKPPARVDF